MVEKQKTIEKEITFHGIGVHSGNDVTVVLRPNLSKTGIVFWTRQFPEERVVVGHMVPEVAMHATVIKQNHWILSTIEHLMAALCLLGVDHVEVEVDGFEVPILDGSAFSFVQGILDVGLLDLEEPRRFITPRQMITLGDNQGRSIELNPAGMHNVTGQPDCGLYVEYTAEFNNPAIGTAYFNKQITRDIFIHDIAPARTFGFLEQLPMLRQHGLAKGSSLGNTVVICHDDFLNEPRFEDECIRHKILDLLGDVALLGKPFAGTIKAHKTGHSFNRLIVEHYLKNQALWTEI